MDNPTSIVMQLLAQLHVPVTQKSIEKDLSEHPDFPSLLSINDILRKWGIHSSAYMVSWSDLKDIQGPFIAHVHANGGKFVIVQEANNQSVLIVNDKAETREINMDDFKQTFTGNVILAEKTGRAGDKDIFNTKRQELSDTIKPYVVFGSLFALLAITLYTNNLFFPGISIRIALIAFLNLSGLIVSSILLSHSVNADNPLIKRLCHWKKTNCSSILSSSASKIWGSQVSWSEVGFFYFLSTFLLLITNGTNTGFLQLLSILSIAVLPYTIYSIYYQARIAKTWCILCCSVQAILWLEFVAFLPYLRHPIQPVSSPEIINILTVSLFPILLWWLVKPQLLKAHLVAPLRKKLNKIKYDESLFQKALYQQARYDLLEDADTIVLGEISSQKTITMITNPNCSFCTETHKLINQWLEGGDEFKLQIVFAPSNDNKIATHLMSLHDSRTISSAFDHWHDSKKRDFESWAKLYPAKYTDDCAEKKLDKQAQWCISRNLESTPTVLIDGYKVPSIYDLEDIRFFI